LELLPAFDPEDPEFASVLVPYWPPVTLCLCFFFDCDPFASELPDPDVPEFAEVPLL
jgi:hypothetical protein